ncbi:MAG: hypothetical protein IKJ35_08400 [Clostridia bacterium]|nr:hypothetical protein [Clostridia bacterium]
MKNQKEEKAILLFREIGEMDDRLIQEAMLYRPKTSAFSHVLLIAACLVFSLMLSVGAFLITHRNVKDENVGHTSPGDGSATEQTLDAILLAQSDAQAASADDIEFFGEKSYVVWQRTDTEEIYVSRALTSYEVEYLTSEISNGTQIEAGKSEPICRVWIVLGDGTALSPHLKPSDGNVGVGELFDYHAELIPSDAFNSKISDILN